MMGSSGATILRCGVILGGVVTLESGTNLGDGVSLGGNGVTGILQVHGIILLQGEWWQVS